MLAIRVFVVVALLGGAAMGADIFLNRPPSGFLDLVPNVSPIQYMQGDAGDFDNDGLSDVVLFGITALDEAAHFLMHQTSPGKFEIMGTKYFPQGLRFNTPTNTLGFALFADYNDDGLQDVITADLSGLTFYRQGPPNLFYNASVAVYPRMEVLAGGVLVRDFNGDGRSDVFLTGYDIGQYSTDSFLYLQQASGDFLLDNGTMLPTSTLGSQFPIFRPGDYNNDSLDDLIICGFDRTIALLRQENGSFVNRVNLNGLSSSMYCMYGFFELRDLNGDGLVDFLGGASDFDYTSYANVFHFQLTPDNFSANLLHDVRYFDDKFLLLSLPSCIVLDFNGDGLMDYLYLGVAKFPTTNYPLVEVMLQQPNHSFIIGGRAEVFRSYTPPLVRDSMLLPVSISSGGRKDAWLQFGSSANYGPDVDLFVAGCPLLYYAPIDTCVPCQGRPSEDYTNCLSCNRTEYFNATLGCTLCPPNSVQAESGLACLSCASQGLVAVDGACVSQGSAATTGASASDIAGAVVGSVGGFFVLLLLIGCCCVCVFCCVFAAIFVALVLLVLVVLVLVAAIGVVGTGSAAGLVVPVLLRRRRVRYTDLIFVDELGSGAFGKVYKGVCRGQVVAIKKINVTLSKEAKEEFNHESRLLESLDHPHIVGFVGTVVGDDACYLVTQLAENGSLDKHPGLPMKHKIRLIAQVADAFVYLHSMGVIHRDISRRNVLLDGDMNALVTDFGLSRVLDDPDLEGSQTKSNIGPVRWLPPEFLSARRYSKAGDVYMYGMFVWELLTELPPYSDIPNLLDVAAAVRSGSRPEMNSSWPSFLCDLMRSCWSADENERPTMREVRALLASNGVVVEHIVGGRFRSSRRAAVNSSSSTLSGSDNDDSMNVPVVTEYEMTPSIGGSMLSSEAYVDTRFVDTERTRRSKSTRSGSPMTTNYTEVE